MNIGEALSNRRTFIVGSAKNAGKTAFLNYALAQLPPEKTAFLTIGVDGEKTDLVFGNPKPAVLSREGGIFLTTDRLLAASDGGHEILEAYPFKTVLGRLVLARAVRGGFVEIAGPENNAQLALILAQLESDYGVKTALIDGAANRITPVASMDGSCFVYVARIERVNFASSLDGLRLVDALSRVPVVKKPRGNAVVIEGALTPEKLSLTGAQTVHVSVEDCTKIFLGFREWVSASKKYKISFRNDFKHLFSVLVLKDVSRQEVEAVLGREILRKTVFNPYAES